MSMAGSFQKAGVTRVRCHDYLEIDNHRNYIGPSRPLRGLPLLPYKLRCYAALLRLLVLLVQLGTMLRRLRASTRAAATFAAFMSRDCFQRFGFRLAY